MPVHPRAYGEEVLVAVLACNEGGSPPCVRGRAGGGAYHPEIQRFTPVRTGKRRAAPAAVPPLTVHPRAYGEELWDGLPSTGLRWVHPRAYGEETAILRL